MDRYFEFENMRDYKCIYLLPFIKLHNIFINLHQISILFMEVEDIIIDLDIAVADEHATGVNMDCGPQNNFVKRVFFCFKSKLPRCHGCTQ